MFSIGHNFEQSLLEKIIGLGVYEFYAKLDSDIIGGGRPSYLLKKINKKKLKVNVESAHNMGIQFNYLLNSSCMGNNEYEKSGQKQIRQLLNYLTEIKVDRVTVAIPYLALFICKHYPNFKIDVSTISSVDNLKKFEHWINLGADTITLDTSVNRDFELLKSLANKYPGKIKLIVNQGCDLFCSFRNYHYNTVSHHSQNSFKGIPISICSFFCRYQRLLNPQNMIAAPWIRPEDLKSYQELGIDKFKIIQRHDKTEKIVATLKAYHSGSHKGNLAEIINFVYSDKYKISHFEIFKILKYFFRPTKINILKLYKLYSNLPTDDFNLNIDNQKLGCFIDQFKNNQCNRNNSCHECGYCKSWGNKVITFNENKKNMVIKNYEKILESFDF
ncbi:MAG: U32 family peptidase [Oligoflexia bacterium]|nr:U32 family peptidase [Oligoflexia bacterium]